MEGFIISQELKTIKFIVEVIMLLTNRVMAKKIKI
jgi:hypothetical protein